MSLMAGQEVLEDVWKWYLKDENASPPVYVLQPISTHLPEFLTTQGTKYITLDIKSFLRDH